MDGTTGFFAKIYVLELHIPNKQYHVKVLLEIRFHLNCQIIGIHPQTLKLELHVKAKLNRLLKLELNAKLKLMIPRESNPFQC